MINKKHLLDSIKEEYPFISEDFYEMVKGFPEEPEIDFDALCKEFNEICLKKDCDNCSSAKCVFDFLKSKKLTVQKLVDIPVKKTWTLKKEYQEYHLKMCIGTMVDIKVDEEPQYPQYYDLNEEPDYSKIPKGSIVEIEFVSGNGNNCGYVNGITNKSISIGFHMLYSSGNSTTINFDKIKSIVILKLAKE